MPLYRLSVRVISRGNTSRLTARNVVAASAYNAREAIYDEREQHLHNYEHRSADLVHSEVLLPETAPDRWFDRATLWNEVDRSEWRRRDDARLARSLILTLPRELPANENVDLARDYVQKAFVGAGMVADLAVHLKTAADGEPQPHAHALLTTRKIVDEKFGLKERAWNSIDLLMQWRKDWADTANRKLAEHGISARLDHRKWFDMAASAAATARDVGRLARAGAIIGAAVTTQAMRDMARRMGRRGRRERRADMAAQPQGRAPAPIDQLREELRRPLREAVVGVAAGAWSYGEAVDRLVKDHLLPATKRHPELMPRLEEFEGKIGDALAKGVSRVEAQISGNAAILRERSEQREKTQTTQAMRDFARSRGANRADYARLHGGVDARRVVEREGVVSESVGQRRDDAAYIAQVADRLGVPRDAKVDRLMATPEVRAMEASVQERIAASASGEVGRLSVDRAATTQEQRDRARQAAPSRAAVSDDAQTQQAARRAQVAEQRSHQLTF